MNNKSKLIQKSNKLSKRSSKRFKNNKTKRLSKKISRRLSKKYKRKKSKHIKLINNYLLVGGGNPHEPNVQLEGILKDAGVSNVDEVTRKLNKARDESYEDIIKAIIEKDDNYLNNYLHLILGSKDAEAIKDEVIKF